MIGPEELEKLQYEELKYENYELKTKLYKIKTWCEAYPLNVFPEPDFKKVHKILKRHGIALDAISASNMRHVLKGIKEIIEE